MSKVSPRILKEFREIETLPDTYKMKATLVNDDMMHWKGTFSHT